MVRKTPSRWQSESLMSMMILRDYEKGECSTKAEAATKILEDQKLFARFVKTRVDRREENFGPKKIENKKLTGLRKCVNFLFSRKA